MTDHELRQKAKQLGYRLEVKWETRFRLFGLDGGPNYECNDRKSVERILRHLGRGESVPAEAFLLRHSRNGSTFRAVRPQ
jgi:hypothetical protein